MKFKGLSVALLAALNLFAATPTVTGVTAQQRYPWNGKVDIAVTLSGISNDVAQAKYVFKAANSATQVALSTAHVEDVGTISGSDTTWTRRFVWDATADVGEVKISDVALSVETAIAHLSLDTRTGTRYARAEEPIMFSTDWNAGTTRLVLNVDGVNMLTATTATNGVYMWRPDLSARRDVMLRLTLRGIVNEALTASFNTTAYDVSFGTGAYGAFTGGGAALQRVPHGEAAVAPTVEPFAGYRFTGWSADTSMVTGRVTAVAQYEMIPYTITYVDLFGATHTNPTSYTVEDSVTFKAPANVPRRRFLRWEPASISVGSTGAVTVRAVWESTPYVYVDATQGNDAYDGVTTAQAVRTLARAYELAEPGNVVVVASGTYEPVTAMGKSVTFRAENGATIDGGGTRRCVMADEDVVFENFMLQHGYDAEAGGGAYGGTFMHCTIRDCVSDWDGGGAYEATLRNCVIVGNKAAYGWGGGAYGGVLDHCMVKDNVAGDEGGGVYAPEYLSETTFSGNYPDDLAGGDGNVETGGAIVYAPPGSALAYTLSCDWLVAAGLAEYGDATVGLDAKLAAPYASGYTGWEAYVVGLTTKDQDFRVEIELVDDEVCISWTPNLNAEAVTRIYAIYGRTDLSVGDWETPAQPWHRFFKVAVAMPTGDANEETAVSGERFVPQADPERAGVQLWEGGPYWAECNVGATQPEEYGYYFWWGDTVGYTRNADNTGWISSQGGERFSFTSGNCPTYDMNCPQLLSAGYIDLMANLVADHDAATVCLGAPWRMPTDAEMQALVSNCTTTWTTRKGVNGVLITGKEAYASKSIFLPAAGYGLESRLGHVGLNGYYWSSTPNSDYSTTAWCLRGSSSIFNHEGYTRIRGLPIRPLRDFAQ